MTLSDIVGWTGVTPSVETCGRGTFFGKRNIVLIPK